jgi:peptidoglycan-N-acetylglucosamine deacetylase
VSDRGAARPPPITVHVGGAPVEVERGTTLGELLRARSLRPRWGRLLDVRGDVLERHASAGRVSLDGGSASLGTPLRNGDRVRVVDGSDRTEPTVKLVRALPRPVTPNPERAIGKAESEHVTVEGKISGEVAADFVRTVGPIDRPKEVALTFDDGPWPSATAKILDILRRHHAPASFFVVGSLADRYPMLVRREVRAGMTVGNHSWSHPIDPAFRDLPQARIEREMADPNRVLARFEDRVSLFRPPGGSWDDDVRLEAQQLGMRLVLWDIDTLDWKRSTTPREITRTVLSQVRPGSIVLMHDGGGDADHTIAALPDIIRGIRERGLELVAL